MYTKSIIIFGIAIPGGGLLIALLVLVSSVNNLEKKSQTKAEAYQSYQMTVSGRRLAQEKLAARSGKMDYWSQSMRQGFVQVMNERLTTSMEKFDPIQLRLVEIGRGGQAGLAKGTEADASSIMLTFEGGFGPMQSLMAELESRIPQLVLDSINISVGKPTGRGDEKGLTFIVIYSAWSKE